MECNGSGSIKKPGSKCEDCQGQGYFELSTGGEAVCPSCNGDGYKIAVKPCSACEGKGFRVGIYELIEDVNVCALCNGRGSIDEKIWYSDLYGDHVQIRQVKCPRCSGDGATSTYSYKTIR